MKWEFDILYALQKIHQPVLDHIMTGLSTIGNAGIFWIVLGLVGALLLSASGKSLWQKAR